MAEQTQAIITISNDRTEVKPTIRGGNQRIKRGLLSGRITAIGDIEVSLNLFGQVARIGKCTIKTSFWTGQPRVVGTDPRVDIYIEAFTRETRQDDQ